MKFFGLIGDPVKHSLSPVMHRAALKEMEVSGYYVKKRVKENELGDVLEGAGLFGFDGLNVTIPYKEEVIGYCDKLGKEADLAGAVNTIKFNDGEVIGYNTDVFGAREAIGKELEISGARALVVGAGGGSRAVCVGLRDAEEIYVVNRTLSKAKDLVRDLGDFVDAELFAFGLEELSDLVEEVDLLVNATPVGLEDPNESILPKSELNQSLVVFDLVYNPPRTKLLRDAEAIGCSVVSGVDMLVLQGAKSLRLWLNKEPPLEVMKESVTKELKGKGAVQ